MIKDNKYKFLGYYIRYEADGREYSKDIDIEARLVWGLYSVRTIG